MSKINHNSIRSKLTAIIEDRSIIDPHIQASEICKLSVTLIKVHSPNPLPFGKTEPEFFVQINCHCYSLGLWEEDIWYTLLQFRARSPNDENFIDGTFVKELLINFKLKPNATPSLNDLVVYYDSAGNVKHSGMYKNGSDNLIESKWGALPIFSHQESEVPDFYGVTTKYFKLPSLSEMKAFFDQYCEDIGIV